MDDYLQQLGARADRAFRGVLDDDPLGLFKSIVGPTSLADFGALAESARKKLADLAHNPPPTADELAALELAIRIMRPAPLVQSDKPAPLSPEAQSTFPLWSGFTALAPLRLAAVGRIDARLPNREIGTGFVVAPDLVMTNRHVVDLLSFGTDTLEPGAAEIKFRMEAGGSAIAQPIAGVVAVHKTADLALLRVAPVDGLTPLPFSDEPAVVGQAVVAVGFPASDAAGNPFFTPLLFGDQFGIKRASPGEVMTTGDSSFQHDCSTLRGNSGSPLLSMETGRVVGVHYEGFFMFRNGAVDAATCHRFVADHAGN